MSESRVRTWINKDDGVFQVGNRKLGGIDRNEIAIMGVSRDLLRQVNELYSPLLKSLLREAFPKRHADTLLHAPLE